MPGPIIPASSRAGSRPTLGGYVGVQQGLVSDPLASIPFALRLQTHLPGSAVPLGMYQDVACTIPVVLDNDPLAAWRDELSGNGVIASQADAAKRLALMFNGGVPTAEFGLGLTEKFLGYSALPSTAAATLFVGIRAAPGAVINGSWELNNSSDPKSYYSFAGTLYEAFGTSVRRDAINPVVDITIFNVYQVTASSSQWTAKMNGASIFTTAVNTFEPSTNATIGSNGVHFFTGAMVFFGIVSRVVTAGEETSVISYIQSLLP